MLSYAESRRMLLMEANTPHGAVQSSKGKFSPTRAPGTRQLCWHLPLGARVHKKAAP